MTAAGARRAGLLAAAVQATAEELRAGRRVTWAAATPETIPRFLKALRDELAPRPLTWVADETWASGAGRLRVVAPDPDPLAGLPLTREAMGLERLIGRRI